MADQDTPDKGGTDNAPVEVKTVPQTEVDRIVEQRLQRERQKYADYEDIKAKAAKADELEAAQSSDLEKAIKRAEKAEAAAEKAGQERDEWVGKAQTNLVRSAVVAEASKRGMVDADAAYQLLPKDKVTVGDDGQVTGVQDAIEQLASERPWLVGNVGPGTGDGGPRQPVAPGGADASSQHNQTLARLFGGG